MVMISIGITEEELENLEIILTRRGALVSFDQLAEMFIEDRQYLRKRISKLARKGWLFRIKRGLYVISDLHSRGTLSISQYSIVNALVDQAYISFESALQYHGYYDQLLNKVSSIATQQYQDKVIDGWYTFSFVRTLPEYFYGWETHQIDGQAVKIASKEKALIDLIQFHRNRYSIDLVLEKLGNYRNEFDLELLIALCLKTNTTVKRILGFVLDCLKLDSSRLYKALHTSKGTSRITDSADNLYNSKWRLHYDRYFERYV
jgi:predicted transcriptional regulator of viral defense system